MTPHLRIRAYQAEIQSQPDLGYVRASNMLMELAAFYGSINDHLLTAEMAYNEKVQMESLCSKTVNRAEINAHVSLEYRDYCEAKNLREEAEKLEACLKYYLRGKENEMQMSMHGV